MLHSHLSLESIAYDEHAHDHDSTMSTPSSRNSVHADSDASGHLQVPGQHAEVIHRLKNVPGYTTPVFKGKEEQRAKVQANVAAKVRAFSHFGYVSWKSHRAPLSHAHWLSYLCFGQGAS